MFLEYFIEYFLSISQKKSNVITLIGNRVAFSTCSEDGFNHSGFHDPGIETGETEKQICKAKALESC